MFNRIWAVSMVAGGLMVTSGCGKSAREPIPIPAEQQIATPTPDPTADIPSAGNFGSAVSNAHAFGSLLTLSNPQSLSCDSKNSGQTVYVRSDSTFSYCNGTSWESVDMRGAGGPSGAAGAAGAEGTAGPQGAQGTQGLTGAMGAQGPIGAMGAQGAQGLTGAMGAKGTVGATGSKGDTGDPGDRVVGWFLKEADGTLIGQIEDEMTEYLDGKVQGEYYLVRKDGYRTIYSKIFSARTHTADGKYFTGTTTLTSLSRQSVPVKAFVFTDTSCSGTPYAALSSRGSYLECVGFGCSWDFSNTQWVTLAFAGKNIIYSYDNSRDYLFPNDCASGSIWNQFKSTSYTGSCKFICVSNGSSWCNSNHLPAAVTGCPISIYAKVFPDSVDVGYTISPQ